jgi:hypothetical protein
MTVAETTLSATGERVRVFEEAPELLQQLENGDVATLNQVTTDLIRLQPGGWLLKVRAGDVRGQLGLLVLDGLLTRQVTVGVATCAELLGAGVVLRPWTELEARFVSIPAESRWQVVLPTRVAVLNARFALQIGRWPDVTAAIIDRVVQRSSRTACWRAWSERAGRRSARRSARSATRASSSAQRAAGSCTATRPAR